MGSWAYLDGITQFVSVGCEPNVCYFERVAGGRVSGDAENGQDGNAGIDIQRRGLVGERHSCGDDVLLDELVAGIFEAGVHAAGAGVVLCEFRDPFDDGWCEVGGSELKCWPVGGSHVTVTDQDRCSRFDAEKFGNRIRWRSMSDGGGDVRLEAGIFE